MKAVLTALALCVPLAAHAAPKAQELILDNGLKVMVKEDRRAPVVTSQVWYRIGSSYEYGGITGVSHVLEHMMFKGTEKHAPGEFSRIVAESGGDENAFTGRDYTAYYQNLAKDRLEISFELEADRMRNLSLPPEEFDKELAVVQEERRLRTDDDPKDLAFERFNAVAYAASPYRNPVIGWEGDLAALTVEDLRDWYRQWYAPNNATLVVVGDVDPEAVFDLARKHFGPLKAEPIAAAKPRPEPAQLGEQRIRVKAPAKEPYLLMGYKATGLSQPGGEDWEPYALEILSSILDGGASTRLQRELVRGAEVAADAGASYSAFTRLPGMVVIDGSPSKGHDIAELETALRGPGPAPAGRARRRGRAGAHPHRAHRQQGLRAGLGVRPGHATGHAGDRRPGLAPGGPVRRAPDPGHPGPDPGRGQQVPDRRQPDRRHPRPATHGRRRQGPHQARRSPPPCPLTPLRPAAQPWRPAPVRLWLWAWRLALPAAASPQIQTWETPNGARVLFVEAPDLPMVDVRLVFDAGSARDGEQAAAWPP